MSIENTAHDMPGRFQTAPCVLHAFTNQPTTTPPPSQQGPPTNENTPQLEADILQELLWRYFVVNETKIKDIDFLRSLEFDRTAEALLEEHNIVRSEIKKILETAQM